MDSPSKLPGQDRVERIKIRMFVRNGSDLPVELTYLALGITTRWMMPDLKQAVLPPGHPNYLGVWDVVPGTQTHKQFTGPINIPPQATVAYDWQEVNIANLAPEGAVQLDSRADSVRCVLRWALVTDNAGRRWQTRHSAGKRAKRIRWWSRHDEHFPYEWKSPVVRRFWQVKNQVRDALPGG